MEKRIEKHKEALEQNSSDYIENILDINGEKIHYRFKQKTNMPKELIAIIPCVIISCIQLFVALTSSFSDNGFDDKYFGVSFLILVIVGIGPPVINVLLSKYTKAHCSWAISENYLVQVKEGVIEIELKKKDISYIDFNGYEIVLDLNIVDKFLEESSGENDKMVLEDVMNAEKVYEILKKWHNE